MRQKVDSRDRGAADIAARQHGMITARQLRLVGLDDGAIARRVRAGRLHRLHRGVYAVGHAGLSAEARWMAAVLACGDGAVLSHGSAAVLWGLLKPIAGPIDVSIPTQAGRRAGRGIRLHRCSTLAAGAKRAPFGSSLVTVRNDIPVTSVPRTIRDLRRSSLPQNWVRRAIRQAETSGVDLGAGVAADGTRSDFEGDFLRLCRRAEVPQPEVNVKVGRWLVDFIWPARRLAVETDSYKFHRGSAAFEDDHARDLDLRARGFEVRRFTEHQVYEQPDRVVADLRAAFARDP